MEFAELIKTPKVDNCILRRSHTSLIEGTLCLTSHHLIFSSRANEDKDELMLLYLFVENVFRKLQGNIGVITVVCKNFTSFKLRIPGIEKAANIAASIEALSTLEKPSLHYPFFYRLDFLVEENGWAIFPLENEYEKLIRDSEDWRMTWINREHKVCRSYPAAVIIPRNVTDDLILKTAGFRQEGRFPILSYLDRDNHVPLLRCSQPLSGPHHKRCKEDEKYLNIILTGHDTKGYIIDTRSKEMTSAQKSKGGGLESESNYSLWKRQFTGIDRYFVLCDSIAKLYDACADTKSGSWLSKLESCGWLSMVETLLTTAITVAGLLHNDGVPVLVHGDAGMDMSLVITSLVQVLLDPDCRTVEGFESLIVREWLWGGHPFSDRNIKLGLNVNRYKGQGSTFLLFLDCVHQIINQYSCSFEFHESFLCLLSEHSYASQFGTFLFNNEYERTHGKIASRTISLWSYLNRPEILRRLTNPLYELNDQPLWISIAPHSLVLWSAMFTKWSLSQGLDSHNQLWDAARKVKETNEDLKEQAADLQREFNYLRQQILSTQEIHE